MGKEKNNKRKKGNIEGEDKKERTQLTEQLHSRKKKISGFVCGTQTLLASDFQIIVELYIRIPRYSKWNEKKWR